MLLTLDMGNTNITIGVFDGDRLVLESRVATDPIKMEDQYAVELLDILRLYGVNAGDIDGSIISSVVPPLDHAIRRAVKKVTGAAPLIVGPGTRTGINIRIDNPAQLGADLLVGAVAAVAKYGTPCIIWDLGTATTVSVIDCQYLAAPAHQHRSARACHRFKHHRLDAVRRSVRHSGDDRRHV